MLAEELVDANARAAAQATERDIRAATRAVQQPALIPSRATSSSPAPPLSVVPRTLPMEDPQLRHVVDSIPTFSGAPTHNVQEWLAIVVLKFDIIGYDPSQRRRFIPQYLSGAALQWHLINRDRLPTWPEYTSQLELAFPRALTTSRDMNLQLLKSRTQGATEAFTDYYTAVLALCRQHTPEMPDLQIVHWLKAGMTVTLFEKLQGEEFVTPQSLLSRAQRVELDNAVLRARRNQLVHPYSPSPTTNPITLPAIAATPISGSYHTANPTWKHHDRPPPLMSVEPPATHYYPSYTTTPSPSYPQPAPYHPVPSQNSSPRQRRSEIICYYCDQPGHIAPRCPMRPKD